MGKRSRASRAAGAARSKKKRTAPTPTLGDAPPTTSETTTIVAPPLSAAEVALAIATDEAPDATVAKANETTARSESAASAEAVDPWAERRPDSQPARALHDDGPEPISSASSAAPAAVEAVEVPAPNGMITRLVGPLPAPPTSRPATSSAPTIPATLLRGAYPPAHATEPQVANASGVEAATATKAVPPPPISSSPRDTMRGVAPAKISSAAATTATQIGLPFTEERILLRTLIQGGAAPDEEEESVATPLAETPLTLPADENDDSLKPVAKALPAATKTAVRKGVKKANVPAARAAPVVVEPRSPIRRLGLVPKLRLELAVADDSKPTMTSTAPEGDDETNENDETDVTDETLLGTVVSPPRRGGWIVAVGMIAAAAGLVFYLHQSNEQKNDASSSSSSTTSTLAAATATATTTTPSAPPTPPEPSPAPTTEEAPEPTPASTASTTSTTTGAVAAASPAPAPSPSSSPPTAAAASVATEQPETPDLLHRANAALRRGDTQTARASFNQVLAKEPGNVEATTGLGDIARRDGDLRTARDHYQRAIDKSPTYVPALLSLADVKWDLGEKGEAKARYSELVDRLGDRAPARVKERVGPESRPGAATSSSTANMGSSVSNTF